MGEAVVARRGAAFETREVEALVAALGQLNRPQLPDVPGRDDFAGASFHSARWDASVDLTGKRVALIGAGPASLTVANDLRPLGYEVTIFEKQAKPGGLMRSNIPSFRLPASVLDEECGYVIDMGAEMRYSTPVTSLKALLDDGYDAVFVRQVEGYGRAGDVAVGITTAIGAGHIFAVVMRGAFPINVLGRIKDVPEVCNIYCATANPVEVIVAETEQGRGILGVVDGSSPKGVETAKDVADRKGFLRKIGYKLS